MSGFLLDTNVISELVRKKPEPKVVRWIQDTDEDLLYLSVLTMGEIRKGITSYPDAARRVKLEAWLSRDCWPLQPSNTISLWSLVIRAMCRLPVFVCLIPGHLDDRLKRETPNLQRAKSSFMTADGRVATEATGQRENLVYETKSKKQLQNQKVVVRDGPSHGRQCRSK